MLNLSESTRYLALWSIQALSAGGSEGLPSGGERNLTVCRQLHVSQLHTFNSWFLLQPVMANFQNWTLGNKKIMWWQLEAMNPLWFRMTKVFNNTQCSELVTCNMGTDTHNCCPHMPLPTVDFAKNNPYTMVSHLPMSISNNHFKSNCMVSDCCWKIKKKQGTSKRNMQHLIFLTLVLQNSNISKSGFWIKANLCLVKYFQPVKAMPAFWGVMIGREQCMLCTYSELMLLRSSRKAKKDNKSVICCVLTQSSCY